VNRKEYLESKQFRDYVADAENYERAIPKSTPESLLESSLSRIFQQYKEHDTGTITAFRFARLCGNGERYTKTENEKNNSILRAKLLKLGYGVTSIKGEFIENFGSANERTVKENSFFVVDLEDRGTLKRDLIKLGTLFEQDSVTYNQHDRSNNYLLIRTNNCPNGYPRKKIGEAIKLGKPLFGKNGEFNSRVGGRPFIFEEFESPVYTEKHLQVNTRAGLSKESKEDIVK